MNEKDRNNFTGEPSNPIPVGEVFPEILEELTNGKGEDEDE